MPPGALVTRLSSLPFVLAFHLSAIFLMLSCASASPPKQILVRVQPACSGTAHIATCVKNSPADNISLDAQGRGSTLCPSQNERIQITIIRGSQTTEIGPSEVSLARTGDGIATISACLLKPLRSRELLRGLCASLQTSQGMRCRRIAIAPACP